MKAMDGWGVTGWSNSWTTLGSDAVDDDARGVVLSGYGIQRKVDPGVVYVAPPEIPGVPRWHPTAASRGRILEMSWPEDRQPVTRSLLDIEAALAARRHVLTADDGDLATLDRSIDMLLATAEALHAADSSIGYLQPNSCRVGEWRDGTPYVVLPDVGFAWDKRAGLMVPNWIAEPFLPQLFEQGAERCNEDYLAEVGRQDDDRHLLERAKDAAARERADVKTLARLVAAALVGPDEIRRWAGDKKPLLKLPARNVATDTRAEIWDKVIAPALAGQFARVKDLRAALATHRPSSHYLYEPPAAPWSGWSILRRTGLVAAAVALIGLLWGASGPLMAWLQGRPAPFCRAVTEDIPLHAKLFSLAKARETARGDVTTRPAYWALLLECHAEHADLATCRSDCLAGLVAEWLEQAEEEGRAVRERLRARPRPTPDEVRDIAAAIAAIHEAEAVTKRTAPSAVVNVLERELRLRGATAPALTPKPERHTTDDQDG
jgi:hypothetical protein